MAARSLRLGLVAFAASMALAPEAARAQLGSGSGPIDITADNGSFDNATCTSSWSGAAEVLQGSARLRANVITVFLNKKAAGSSPEPKDALGPDSDLTGAAAGSGCGETRRVEADGDVYYVTPTLNARADHAVYIADEGVIVMTGNVIVVQGKDVVHGDKMTIHTAAHQVVFDSTAKGRGTPGRVRAVFYPGKAGEPGLPDLGAPAAATGSH